MRGSVIYRICERKAELMKENTSSAHDQFLFGKSLGLKVSEGKSDQKPVESTQTLIKSC